MNIDADSIYRLAARRCTAAVSVKQRPRSIYVDDGLTEKFPKKFDACLTEGADEFDLVDHPMSRMAAQCMERVSGPPKGEGWTYLLLGLIGLVGILVKVFILK